MSTNKKITLELQSILDSHSNPFVLIDESHTIIAANKAYCDAYGVPSDKVVGAKCHKVSHHFDTPCPDHNEKCPLSTVLQTQQPYEVLHIHFDHHDHPEHVRVKGLPIIGSKGQRYVGEEIIRLAPTAELGCEEQRFVGTSKVVRECIEDLVHIAETEANVLLYGEEGVGKHLAAQFIHQRSPRAGHSYVQVDCRRTDEALFERELFGHERGAYAGCVGRRHGLLDDAEGGTLFFNEISELPLSVQGRLASALESGTFRRIGGRESIKLQARVICSTSHLLQALVEADKFRADLFYCITGVVKRIPPLRERCEDIPALADALLTRVNNPSKRHCHIQKDAQDKLKNYMFPGNLAELRNVLQKASMQSNDGIIRAEHIQFDEAPNMNSSAGRSIDMGHTSLKNMEAEQIGKLLLRHKGHRRRVAEELGISERTLYRKLKKYGLEDPGQTLAKPLVENLV